MSAERKKTFMTAVRAQTTAIWNAYHALKALQLEWQANDFTTADPLGDGSGPHEGITQAQFSSMVFDTTDEIKLRIFDTAHKTNLAKLL